jgi:segregation and condensation protein B
MDQNEIKYFVEAALLAAGRPLGIDQLHNLFEPGAAPEKAQLRQAIAALQEDYAPRGLEIVEVASGFRTQVKASMADRLQKLWEERPPRYSRALFETLALIAYRQPITRGEIEEIRGVSVSPNIIRSLLERDWIRVVGHRDVPGRPAMFGTTRTFLDYFGLKKLDDLPPLADLSDWESLRVQLNLPEVSEDESLPETAEITELPVARHAAEVEADAGDEAPAVEVVEAARRDDDDDDDFDDDDDYDEDDDEDDDDDWEESDDDDDESDDFDDDDDDYEEEERLKRTGTAAR